MGLDAVLAWAQSPIIDILKIDVEGYELHALLGAEEVLASGVVKFLVLEYQPSLLSLAGADHIDVLKFLWPYGFECGEGLAWQEEPADSETFEAFGERFLRPENLQM